MDEQLAWLTDLFASHGVTHWVESGTLLTLVRSGRLTEYDDDIDVAMWSSDLDAMPSLVSEVQANGYQVQKRSYAGYAYKYQFIPEEGEAGRETTGRRLVDVMVFRKSGAYAWTAQSRLAESLPVPGVATLLQYGLPLIRRYARTTSGEMEMTDFPEHLFTEVLTLWLPLRFVENLDFDDELGVHVPTALDDYLAFRYGDWRTPVEEWSLTDDGAVRGRSPAPLLD